MYPFGSCPNDCQAGPGANGGDNGGGGGGGAGGGDSSSSSSIANFRTTLGGRLASPGRTPAGGGGMCSCDYDGDEARPDCQGNGARPRCWCHYAWGEGARQDCGGRTRTLNGETEPGGPLDGLKALLEGTWPTSWRGLSIHTAFKLPLQSSIVSFTASEKHVTKHVFLTSVLKPFLSLSRAANTIRVCVNSLSGPCAAVLQLVQRARTLHGPLLSLRSRVLRHGLLSDGKGRDTKRNARRPLASPQL